MFMYMPILPDRWDLCKIIKNYVVVFFEHVSGRHNIIWLRNAQLSSKMNKPFFVLPHA